LSQIIHRKAKTRCTTCKRNNRIAISEQAAVRLPCDVAACDFIAEIVEAIEAKYKFSITPKEKKKLNVIEKERSKINIIRK
jgi:hypothetical protein